MREIKFRGKRIDNGEWIEGDLHLLSKRPHIHTDLVRSFPIDINTIGQFTGLVDKNGTKIFEGDILSTHPIIASDRIGCNTFNVKVRFDETSWIANGLLGKYQCAISKVIGNIFDNPELLK